MDGLSDPLWPRDPKQLEPHPHARVPKNECPMGEGIAEGRERKNVLERLQNIGGMMN